MLSLLYPRHVGRQLYNLDIQKKLFIKTNLKEVRRLHFIRTISNSTTCRKMEERVDHLDLTKLHFRDPLITEAEVVSIKQLSPDIKGLTLKVEKNDSGFKAGQWMDFFMPGVDTVGGFSMCSAPELLTRCNLVDLAVKFSTWPPANWVNTKCKVGDKVSFRFGGDFFYPPEKLLGDHSILLLAGGVGINPLYSIWLQARHLRQTNDENQPSKVSLLYSAATKDAFIFKDVIDCTTAKYENFSCQYFQTRGPDGAGRMSQESLKSALSGMKVPSGDSPLCYLCGPPEFIKQMNIWLLDLNVPKDNIMFEMWW